MYKGNKISFVVRPGYEQKTLKMPNDKLRLNYSIKIKEVKKDKLNSSVSRYLRKSHTYQNTYYLQLENNV